MRTAFVGGSVIDGTDGSIRPNCSVEIDDGVIVAVTPRRTFDPGTQVVDVSGKTVMPGIIDTHMHFASWAQWLVAYPGQRLMFLASRTVGALDRALQTGVTSARDMGGLEAGFAQAVAQGVVTGPRLQNAVLIIQPTNGVCDNLPSQGGYVSCMGLSTRIPGTPDPHCDGPWEARKKVREVLRAGADVIKIASTSVTVKGVMNWTALSMTTDELDAIVDEAHGLGLQVLDHAMGQPGVMRAVAAGVDSVEHGCHIDDATLEEMARRGTWLVPMFWVLQFHVKVDPTEDTRAQAVTLLEETARTVERARRIGVPIAMGSDGGVHDPDGTASLEELQFMADAGMTNAEVLVAATRRAAECMRIQDQVGTLTPGKAADLLVVDGNPLQDLRVLQQRERMWLVLKGGVPAGGTMLARDLPALAKSQALG